MYDPAFTRSRTAELAHFDTAWTPGRTKSYNTQHNASLQFLELKSSTG